MNTETTISVESAAKEFLVKWQEMIDMHQAKNFPNIPRTVLSLKIGPKWIRVIRDLSSVSAFIDAVTGNIYKPASWRGPAKHSRGSIFSPKNGMEAVGVYGVNYLR